MKKSPKKKVFTSRLSFDAAELRTAMLSMYGGINMPVPKTEDALYKEFGLEKKAINSFGWMGNTPQFFPDLKVAADLMPKEEDFIRVPFRLISATIVGAGTWKCTDFSDVKALKKSTKMLEGKPLYKDHETDLDNWVGYVEGVKWSEAKVDTAANMTVPAGIDGIVVVDAKTNPKVARGLLIGAIFSNSVTVEFNWEMSHEFENEYDFNRNIGTLGKDGKMVRRVVTQVNNYHESSLVWLGADPFAKMIEEDGTLKNIDVTGVVQYDKADQTTKDQYEKNKKFVASYEIQKSIVYLTKRSENEPTKIEPLNDDKMNPKFLAALLLVLGKPADTKLTDDEAIAALSNLTPKEGAEFTKMKAGSEAFAKLTKVTFKTADDKVESVELKAEEVEAIGAEGTVKLGGKELVIMDASFAKGLTDKITELTPLAEVGTAQLKAKREEITRLYKKTVGEDKADPAVIETFEKAEAKALDGLLAQYTKGATAKFTATCKSCQGTDFEFRSTLSGGEQKDSFEKDADAYISTSSDLQRKYGKSGVHNS